MTNEVYVIRRILKFVEVSNLINLKNVIDVGQLEAYVTKLLEKNTVPSSIKKYIGSLRDFLQFLTTRDQYCMDAATIAKTDTILSHWAKNFKKKDKVCTHKRKQDDRELLIDKRQVSAFGTIIHTISFYCFINFNNRHGILKTHCGNLKGQLIIFFSKSLIVIYIYI